MGMQTFAVAPEGGKRVQFKFMFWVDRDNGREHEFGAVPMTDPVQVARINRLAAARGGEGVLELIEAVQSAIRRMLDDSDGTPTDWIPVAAPDDLGEAVTVPDGVDWPSATTGDLVPAHPGGEQLDDEEPEPRFIAPDGTFQLYDNLTKYTSPQAGSSLRRWRALMDDSNDLIVPVEQLLQLWRWLVAEAGKGRTAR